jgi:hypothetical protein
MLLNKFKKTKQKTDLTLILRKKMETFADTSAFNAGIKEKNTKTNKITIAKNQKLATQNFLFNMQTSTMYITKGKIFNFLNGACANLH